MTTLKRLFLASLWILLLTACEKEELVPNMDNKLLANAGADREWPFGSPTQLDGSGSRDGNNLPFTYQWTIKSKPENSSPNLLGHTEEKAMFTPDQVGVYEIELKIQNHTGESKAVVKITAVPASAPVAVILNQDITQNRVLEDIFDDPTQPDYIVTADIRVRAQLTVMPGVVVAFEDKKGMVISQSGSLVAKGAENKKIVFTGKQETKGYWSGIVFTNNNPLNELLHAEVNYAGAHPIYPMAEATAVGVAELSYLKMTYTAVQHSASNGLLTRHTAVINIGRNVFRYNETINITLPVKEAHKLDSETVIEAKNESVNYVELIGNELEERAVIVWKKLQNNVKYRIKESLTIHGALTIEKGVKIGVAPDRFIRIFTEGSLAAIGSSDEPIIFDVLPTDDQKWRGLVVSSSKNVNRLEWVELKNAGNGQSASGMDKSAAIGISNVHGNRISLKQVKIKNSDGHGIYVHQAGMLGEFDHITFSGIKNHVMALPVSNVRNIQEAQITTSNNLKNSIEILEGNMNFPGETIWSPLSGGVTYYLPNSMQVVRGGLKLMPGVKVEFGPNALLTILKDAYFTAIGTAENKIELKGNGDQHGYWAGILIKSKNIQNIIRHTHISGGGSQVFPGLGNARANLGITTEGRIIITNSKISKGSGWGIVVESTFGGILHETDNLFENLNMGHVVRL